ncbi:DUF2919 family protein [Thalassotalea sediminis]|uniref:DUF2919 family protein n=1 Tax=Thalassotalea sediminis TaxID=1759089 RepID=UPI00257446E0|nr:DUF2919 family protein [Thalassotalea sediminis]
MKKQNLKNIPISSFDNNGWLKPPFLLLINLIYLSKGLLLFIFSLASRQNGGDILSFFYPDKYSLYIAIALSIIPLLTIVSFTIGTIGSNLVLKRVLLSISAVLLLVKWISTANILAEEYKLFSSPAFYTLLVHSILIILALTSYKVKLFIKQFIKKKGFLEQDSTENKN